MPPRRPARPAPPDVQVLRSALEAGKIVRVGLAPSDQFPDGITGRVRRIGDPASDGDEYIFVEVAVGGAKDTLPFAVTDLIAAPGRRAAPAQTPAAMKRVPAAPRSLPAPRAQTAPATPTPVLPAAPRPPAAPALGSPAPAAPTVKLDAPASPEKASADVPRASRPTGGTGGGPRRTGGSGRGKRPAVTITIATAGDESAVWRIEARIGARVAVRPTVIPPSRVWGIVESLGEPALTTLVESLLDDHRRSTQARADALAAELATLEEELRSFPAQGARGTPRT